jgi:hypothetical protein
MYAANHLAGVGRGERLVWLMGREDELMRLGDRMRLTFYVVIVSAMFFAFWWRGESAMGEAQPIPVTNGERTRAEFIGTNYRIVQLFIQAGLSDPQLVNVGKVAGDGTGDTLTGAIAKINWDLDQLAPYVLKESTN